MKVRKIIFYVCIVVTTFLIYRVASNNKINYVTLGDGLSKGINPYGEVGYGYSDYLSEYLKKENNFKDYINEFADTDYRISDVISDIAVNKRVIHNDSNINIRSVLRESDLVTISIGFNDLIKIFSINNIGTVLENKTLLEKEILYIANKYDEVLTAIRKYAKSDIIVIGFYNPYQYLNTYKSDIDYYIKNLNSLILEICKKHNVKFIDLYNVFNGKLEYLPNPNSIYPTELGYREIFNIVKNSIN